VTLDAVTRRGYGALLVAAFAFVALAIGARLDALVWDKHVTDAVLGARTGFFNDLALRVSFLGSTPVVATVAVVLAAVAWRRCPRLAIAIAVLALARPLVEFCLKELVDRPRPAGDRLVRGKGPAFPSGHPFAFALTWGLVPMVVALYTRRRAVWLAVAGVMWTLAVFVAASRVWLGVHWFSDVIAGLLLAVLGVSAAEAMAADRGCGCVSAGDAAPSTP
jgi:undecaprenyl-diphosphatase